MPRTLTTGFLIWIGIAPGAKLYGDDTNASDFPTIFNLLKDGSAHTFYFFFWIDQANNAVINKVELWEGVGTCDTYGGTREVITLDFIGLATVYMKAYTVAGGNATIGIYPALYYAYASNTGNGVEVRPTSILINGEDIRMKSPVATDLAYLEGLYLNLRSEQ